MSHLQKKIGRWQLPGGSYLNDLRVHENCSSVFSRKTRVSHFARAALLALAALSRVTTAVFTIRRLDSKTRLR